MPQEQTNTENQGKTGALLVLGNTLLAPLYWADTRLGISTALIATGAFLYVAYEEGKKRRPVANAVNNANTFFGAHTGDRSTAVNNALANIAEGGAALFDEMMPQMPPNQRM